MEKFVPSLDSPRNGEHTSIPMAQIKASKDRTNVRNQPLGHKDSSQKEFRKIWNFATA